MPRVGRNSSYRVVAGLFIAISLMAFSTGCTTETPRSAPSVAATPSVAFSASPAPIAASPGAASPHPRADDGAFRIGFVTTLTGIGAPNGIDMVNGLKLYLEQNHYRIAGRKVELIVENDGGNPATAMESVRKLIEQDKVQVVAGFLLANIGYVVAPLADRYKVPMILVIVASDDITQRLHYNWVVRIGWTSSQPSHPFGEWVYKTLGYRRVVTLGADYAFGWEGVGGFQQTFEAAGGQIVQKIWAPLGTTYFMPFIQQIHADADALFVFVVGLGSESFPKQYRASGVKLPLIGGGVSFDESVLRHQGDESIGVISPLMYSAALDTPANKRFVAAYRAAYDADPSFFAESSYDAGMLLREAATAVGGDIDNHEKFCAALKKCALPDAPRGPITLDDRANPIENIYVRKVEKVGGKLCNTVIYTYPKVSQFWTYDPQQYLKQPAYSKDFPPCTHCDKPSVGASPSPAAASPPAQ